MASLEALQHVRDDAELIVALTVRSHDGTALETKQSCLRVVALKGDACYFAGDARHPYDKILVESDNRREGPLPAPKVVTKD